MEWMGKREEKDGDGKEGASLYSSMDRWTNKERGGYGSRGSSYLISSAFRQTTHTHYNTTHNTTLHAWKEEPIILAP